MRKPQVEKELTKLRELNHEMATTNITAYPLKAVVLSNWCAAFDYHLKRLAAALEPIPVGEDS